MENLGAEDAFSEAKIMSSAWLPPSHQFSSSVAQLVEHRTVNPLVPGSIPGRGAKAECIPCLLGPSCSGKTFLASRLIEAMPVSIINIDSGLMFREMDIGTAKPVRPEEYFLINILSPDEIWSAFEFKERVKLLIPKIIAEGRVPVITGGSLFYYKMLAEALDGVPTKNRYTNIVGFNSSRCESKLQFGWLRPTHYSFRCPIIITRNILKIFLQIGVTGLHLSIEHRNYQFLPLILFPSNLNSLKKRLASRFENMIANGLVEEVVFLKRKYRLNPASHCMRLIGYSQVLSYLNGTESYGLMKRRALASTAELVKKQLAWIKSLTRYAALDCSQPHQQLLQSTMKLMGRFV